VREGGRQQVEPAQGALGGKAARDLAGYEPPVSAQRVEILILEEPEVLEVDDLRIELANLLESDPAQQAAPGEKTRRAG